jgi:hypothetical protein
VSEHVEQVRRRDLLNLDALEMTDTSSLQPKKRKRNPRTKEAT